MLLGKATWENVWCIKSLLRAFELVSGLKVNFHKSKLIGINVPDGFLDRASVFLFCRTEAIPFKFLGIPIGANPRREATWSSILGGMRKRLASWKGRLLSIGGRVTLINSVLNSIPLYMFSFYKAPKVVIKKMVKIQRDFLWGVKEGDNGMYWVAWDRVCKPKNEGGLGIKNLEFFNIALLTKWKWRALTDCDVSWSGLLRYRYGDFASCFIHDSLEGISRRNAGSIWWRDLIGLDANLEEQRRFAWCAKRGLGDGASILFWKDQWIGIEPLFKVFPLLFDGVVQQQITVAEFGNWNEEAWQWLNPWNQYHDQVRKSEGMILDSILQAIQPIRGKQDSWVWPHDNSKCFTVKSFYQKMICTDASSNDSSPQHFLGELWKSIVPSKVVVFGWRLLLNSLPVREALWRRNVLHSEQEVFCSLCSNNSESINHLFFSCRFAQAVWQQMGNWLGFNLVLSPDIVDLFLACGRLCNGKKAKRTKHMFWLTTCWSIWLARNNVIFKNEESSVEAVITRIKSLTWSWCVYRLNCCSSFSISMWWSNPLQCLSNM